jgi:hypothetical protein
VSKKKEKNCKIHCDDKDLKKLESFLKKNHITLKCQEDLMDLIFNKKHCNSVKVKHLDTEVTAKVSLIPGSGPIVEGFALTGVIDTEKLIKIENCCKKKESHTLFLEKKLPFQILALELETDEDCKDEDEDDEINCNLKCQEDLMDLIFNAEHTSSAKGFALTGSSRFKFFSRTKD